MQNILERLLIGASYQPAAATLQIEIADCLPLLQILGQLVERPRCRYIIERDGLQVYKEVSKAGKHTAPRPPARHSDRRAAATGR